MNSHLTPAIPCELPASNAGEQRQLKAWMDEVDASCRLAVLTLFGWALFWLLVGTVLALIASWKMHSTDFLSDIPWLTFGRVRPAHLNAVIYGFATQAALGACIWLMCRLCRTQLMHQWLIIMAALFWNGGVALGLGAVLGGDSAGVEWLEFPSYVRPVLFASFCLISASAIITFRMRQQRQLYVSHWYILAALFCFPWIYSSAGILLNMESIRGTVQAAVNWWYVRNLLGLWFTPVALASLFYFIPKIIGRPIHSHQLSLLGFWSLALFMSWSGMHHLVGGPLPAWLITVSIMASVMMGISVMAVAINLHLTMKGNFHWLKSSPVLRFMFFGGVMFAVASLQGVLSALRSVSEVTHFTHLTIAHAHAGMYAFFSMIMFGAMYYIIPRLTLCEWPSARLISLHFWGASLGILLYIVPLTYGGVIEGMALLNPDILFLDIVKLTIPYLQCRSAAGFLIAISQLALMANFVWMLRLMRMEKTPDRHG